MNPVKEVEFAFDHMSAMFLPVHLKHLMLVGK